jgi:hypothetical protein
MDSARIMQNLLLVGMLLAAGVVDAQVPKNTALIVVAAPVCAAAGEGCTVEKFKSSWWRGCNDEPNGCYEREFKLTLQKGLPVDVVAIDPTGEWAQIKEANCRGECAALGWIRRSRFAYLREFKRMRTWTSERVFRIELGDYVDVFTVEKDGRFHAGEDRGNMYIFGDVIWGRLRNNPSDTQFVFVATDDEGKYCWTTDPWEGTYAGEKWNCFSPPRMVLP